MSRTRLLVFSDGTERGYGVTGDLPIEPDDFDPFAGFSGGMDQPGSEPFHPSVDLFDASGLALQFGPPLTGGSDDAGDAGHQDLSWYDAPHHW